RYRLAGFRCLGVVHLEEEGLVRLDDEGAVVHLLSLWVGANSQGTYVSWRIQGCVRHWMRQLSQIPWEFPRRIPSPHEQSPLLDRRRSGPHRLLLVRAGHG